MDSRDHRVTMDAARPRSGRQLLDSLVLGIAFVGTGVGMLAVYVIAAKSGFGARFAAFGNDVLQYGIEYSLLAAVCWGFIAWPRRRLLFWPCGLCLAMGAAVFGAYWSGVACESKKARMCAPLYPFLDERPSILLRQH